MKLTERAGAVENHLRRRPAMTVLDWLIEHAQQSQCTAMHLDTGDARHATHRLYLRKSFQLNYHHLTLPLTPDLTIEPPSPEA